ncbi:hypothetical protein [Brevundimonas sp. FT23042]|uniref:hypothetical protein n=1 Tax=Brevundimonas sp. FT23042 TaxID=3393749 RepID=UPI003B5890FE
MSDRSRHLAMVVEPAATGWILSVGGAENAMIFTNGSAAEKAARALTGRLAAAGAEVELEIRIRGGAIAARYVCFPDPPRGIDGDL